MVLDFSKSGGTGCLRTSSLSTDVKSFLFTWTVLLARTVSSIRSRDRLDLPLNGVEDIIDNTRNKIIQ